MKGFANLDAPKDKQKGITAEFLIDLQEKVKGGRDATRHAANLIEGGYFFAMRGGEFAWTRVPLKTKRICLRDVTFRDDKRRVVPHNDPRLSESATRVTICFRDQKNGEKNERRTQKATNEVLCPVKAWIRIVNFVWNNVWNASPDTPVATVRASATGSGQEVTLDATVKLMKSMCKLMAPVKNYGFEDHELGARSIRTGAAMALFMVHKDPLRVMILGRWKSMAFMEYIRPQVLELTDDLATAMTFVQPMTDLAEREPLPTRQTKRTKQSFRPFQFY